MERRNIGSGYAFEETYGYSRAVRVNDHVYVSGTTARGAVLGGSAYEQARAILGLIEAALVEAEAQMQHVVRTVVYVTDLAFQDEVARAHGEAFGSIRPASTLVQVVALTPSTARVEIEVTAIITE
jgi:enamine deaminase RidA (YjgF/YER057c/UK114 family)